MGGGWIHRIGRGDSWKRQTGPGASKIQVREEKPENRILENTRGMSSGAARGIKITQSIWIQRRWTTMKNTRQEKRVDTSYVGNEKLNQTGSGESLAAF